MKQLPLFKKNKKILFFLIIFSTLNVLLLSSCLKDSNNESNEVVAAVTVIHGSPDAPAVDFVLNRGLISANLAFGLRVRYFSWYAGQSQASFYPRGTITNPLHTSTISLTQGKYYSLFLAGLEADSLSTLLIEDDLTQPATGKAKLRFINLSPDAGALDFAVVPDSLFASQKNFKEYSSFYEINPGTYSAMFMSSTGNLVDYDFDLKLDAGKTYTVWARGLVQATNDDQEFENGLIIHDQ